MLHVCLKIVARNARCNTMSHLTADAVFCAVHLSREVPDVTPCHSSPPQGVRPESAKRATSVNAQLLRPWKDLRTGSISRGIVSLPSELCRRRSGVFMEVARLVPPDMFSSSIMPALL